MARQTPPTGGWNQPAPKKSQSQLPPSRPGYIGSYRMRPLSTQGAGTSGYQSPNQIAASVVSGRTYGGAYSPEQQDQQGIGTAAADLAAIGGLPGLRAAAAGQGQVPTAGMGAMFGGNAGGGGRSGGGGGGGVNRAALTAQADQLFKYDPTANDTLRGQVNAYDPNLAGMMAGSQANLRAIEDERTARVRAQLDAMMGLAGGVAQSNSGAMQMALRDLGRQGVNVNPLVDQQIQTQGQATAGLSNQAAYANALQGLGTQGYAQAMNTSNLINQGAQSNLANNRQLLLNQVGQQEQAQRQQLDQARREFLLKYGVTA